MLRKSIKEYILRKRDDYLKNHQLVEWPMGYEKSVYARNIAR